MPEEVVQGNSLEEIRKDYCKAWGCRAEQLNIEILKKPFLLSRKWIVKVSLDSMPSTDLNEVIKLFPTLEGNKYVIEIPEGVKLVEPYPLAGVIKYDEQVQDQPFSSRLEYFPVEYPGELTWEFSLENEGLQALARVKHERPGHYILPSEISTGQTLCLSKVLVWEETTYKGTCWDETKFKADLTKIGIVYGIEPYVWQKVQKVSGVKDIVIANGIQPISPVQPRVENMINSLYNKENEDIDITSGQIDFFASKVRLVKEGEVLARIIPGKPGIHGRDVLGREITCPHLTNLEFKLRKNVHLSESGSEVIASCEGLPIRIDEVTYGVEEIYVVNKDVDLETGSIEFPENVFISGNVQDGLHVFSGGMVSIQGSVYKAEVRANSGLKICHNAIGSKLIVGEDSVNKSKLLQLLKDLNNSLTMCLLQTEKQIISLNALNAKIYKSGQILKLMIERSFLELPRLADNLEKFVTKTKGDFLSQELIMAIKTINHYLNGLGPTEKNALNLVKTSNSILESFINGVSIDIDSNERLNCCVDYIQGTIVECAGDLECFKGVYNSILNIKGDVKIHGACRGSIINTDGNVNIKEVGGHGISKTTIQIPVSKRLKIDFCHPSLKVFLGKELIEIKEDYRYLEIFSENGRVVSDRIHA